MLHSIYVNEYTLNKEIQEITRQRLLDGNGTHFITFKFLHLWNHRTASFTPFNKQDVWTATDLIGEWTWRMDRRLLGGKAHTKPLSSRMKFVAGPEVHTKHGRRTPLHFHAIYEVNPDYWLKLERLGRNAWDTLLRETCERPASTADPKKGIDIRRIEDARPASYAMKQAWREWNWENMIDHHQFHPTKTQLTKAA